MFEFVLINAFAQYGIWLNDVFPTAVENKDVSKKENLIQMFLYLLSLGHTSNTHRSKSDTVCGLLPGKEARIQFSYVSATSLVDVFGFQHLFILNLRFVPTFFGRQEIKASGDGTMVGPHVDVVSRGG